MILLIPFLVVALVALLAVLVVAAVVVLGVWALCAAAARADREEAGRRLGDGTITVRRVRRGSAGR